MYVLLYVYIVHKHIIYVVYTYIKIVCFSGFFEKPTTSTGTDLMWYEGSLWVCTDTHTHRPYPVPILYTPFASLHHSPITCTISRTYHLGKHFSPSLISNYERSFLF